MMGPLEAMGSVVSRPFQFTGRAPRSEFWWFVLFDVLIRISLVALDGYLLYNQMLAGLAIQDIDPWNFFSVYYNIAIFFPYLALCVRRLHDGGFSGFWMALYPLSTILLTIYSILDVVGQFFDVISSATSGAQAASLWFLVAGVMASLILFVMLVWPSEADDNIHGAPWRRIGGQPRVTKDGTIKSDPMQAYALLMEIERKKSPEEIAAREEARKEEVRSLYQQRVLGQT